MTNPGWGILKSEREGGDEKEGGKERGRDKKRGWEAGRETEGRKNSLRWRRERGRGRAKEGGMEGRASTCKRRVKYRQQKAIND
jgi:hypothetical protein